MAPEEACPTDVPLFASEWDLSSSDGGLPQPEVGAWKQNRISWQVWDM